MLRLTKRRAAICGVGQPLGHQAQHLGLARGQAERQAAGAGRARGGEAGGEGGGAGEGAGAPPAARGGRAPRPGSACGLPRVAGRRRAARPGRAGSGRARRARRRRRPAPARRRGACAASARSPAPVCEFAEQAVGGEEGEGLARLGGVGQGRLGVRARAAASRPPRGGRPPSRAGPRRGPSDRAAPGQPAVVRRQPGPCGSGRSPASSASAAPSRRHVSPHGEPRLARLGRRPLGQRRADQRPGRVRLALRPQDAARASCAAVCRKPNVPPGAVGSLAPRRATRPPSSWRSMRG